MGYPTVVKVGINLSDLFNFSFGMLVHNLWQAHRELHHIVSGPNMSEKGERKKKKKIAVTQYTVSIETVQQYI